MYAKTDDYTALKTMIYICKKKINELNIYINEAIEKYNNWQNTIENDERYKKYTREEFKQKYIDYYIDEKKRYTNKLTMAENGYLDTASGMR